MELDVRHVAKLARLKIEDNEVESLEKELSAIVKMVENLPEIASDEALLDKNNTMELREDEIIPSYPREKILQNAPEQAEGCFVVPRTVE